MTKSYLVNKQVNLLLIGFGPHARRIYFPISVNDGKKSNFRICHGVELKSQKQSLEKFFIEKNYEPIDMLYLEEYEISFDNLNSRIEFELDKVVKEKNITGVIIATEPLAHTVYAKWALKRGLSILMDKPISTRVDVSTDEKAVEGLYQDYLDLEKLYVEAKHKNPKILFSLMAQRRYHPAFNKIRELISEVYKETNCPVTSIQMFHSDGQWRLPTEIVEQHYHPYNQGYGKCSHSGYHSIDMIPWIIEAAENPNKKINNVDVFTNIVRPNDFLSQINIEDYRKFFPDFDKYNKYTESELRQLCKSFGEIDAFNSFSFKHNNEVMTLSSANLIHNGFAQRNWATAEGRDLYKGNGRVRHESHYIEQGPFQAISYISYQGKEVDPNNLDGIYEVGGEYHLDLHVFRNDKMFPKWKNYEKISINNLGINILEGKSRGHQEDARREAVVEFADYLNGKDIVPKSDYLVHWRSTILLYGIYKSIVARHNNENPLINIPYLHSQDE